MTNAWPLALLVPVSLLSQTQPVTQNSGGPCAANIVGNNNQVFTCQGLDSKKVSQMLAILNQIAKSQADLTSIAVKVDGCLQAIEKVRERQAPWRLSESQAASLRNAEFIEGTKVEVRVIAQDRDAALFGIDILEALVRTKMGVSRQLVTDHGLHPGIEGVLVAGRGDQQNESRNSVLVRRALTIALASHVPYNKWVRDREPFTNDDTVIVIVGGRPQPR